MKEIGVDVCAENIEQIMLFVNEQLESFKCPVKAQMQMNIVIDELFGNITRCAGNPEALEECPPLMCVKVNENPLSVIITFMALSGRQEEISGLGSYIADKCMDEISYEYTVGQHILTIMKHM